MACYSDSYCSSSSSSADPGEDYVRRPRSGFNYSPPQSGKTCRFSKLSALEENSEFDKKSNHVADAGGDCSNYLLQHSPFAIRVEDDDISGLVAARIVRDVQPPIFCVASPDVNNKQQQVADKTEKRRVTVAARYSSWIMLLLSDGASEMTDSIKTVDIFPKPNFETMFFDSQQQQCSSPTEMDSSFGADNAKPNSVITTTVRPIIIVTVAELDGIVENFASLAPAVRYFLERRMLLISCPTLNDSYNACCWLKDRFFSPTTDKDVSKQQLRWHYIFNRTVIELPIQADVSLAEYQRFWRNVWLPLRQLSIMRELGKLTGNRSPTTIFAKRPQHTPQHLSLSLAINMADPKVWTTFSVSQLEFLLGGEVISFMFVPPALFGGNQNIIRADSAWASVLRLQALMRHPRRTLRCIMFSANDSNDQVQNIQETQAAIIRIANSKPHNFLLTDPELRPSFLDISLFVRTYHNHLQFPLLLPAVDVKESTYENWERDIRKYVAYRNAIYDAVKVRAARNVMMIVYVVGPGRGRFMFYVLDACQRMNIPPSQVRLYAVEKNPRAVEAIMKKFETEPTARTTLPHVSYEPQSTLCGYYRVEETRPHEFNVIRPTKHGEGGYYVRILYGDYRNWSGPSDIVAGDNRHADIVVSELMGALGCNELKPECLASRPPTGRQRPITGADTVFIPKNFASYVMPIMSAELERSLHRLDPAKMERKSLFLSSRCSSDVYDAQQSVWETCVGVFLPLAEPQQLFRFDFPDQGEAVFERKTHLKFIVRTAAAQFHGFLAFFKANVDDNHEISLCPFTGNCSSWGQMFFPARATAQLTQSRVVEKGHVLTLDMVRRADSDRIWYAWAVGHNDDGAAVVAENSMSNANGVHFSIPLYGQSLPLSKPPSPDNGDCDW